MSDPRPVKFDKLDFRPIVIGGATAYLAEGAADGTKYALIGFPRESINVGYFGNGYLLIDPFHRSAYVFGDHVFWEYLAEKWRMEDYEERDARNTAQLANALIQYIEEAKSTKEIGPPE